MSEMEIPSGAPHLHPILKMLIVFGVYIWTFMYGLDYLSETEQAKYLAKQMEEPDLERPIICYSDKMNITHPWFYRPEKGGKNYTSKFPDYAKMMFPEEIRHKCKSRNCEYVTYFDVDVHWIF